jgi:O-antigen ligase
MGLLDHPNHLGHVLALVLIGLIAWISGQPRVSVRWWLAVGAAALGMAVTQSRESVLATLGAAVLIWFLRRGGLRPILVCAAIITVMFGGYTLARPGNLTELLNRFGGVTSAVDTPSGNEDCEGFETNRECVEAGKVEKREIRLLFFQQGARLLADRPVLGYGVGQFGGIVAEKNDPNWELDPRFPGGFDLYDFDGTTVDSFWLHLVVETGVVGLLSYLAWLALIVVPLLGVTRRFAGRRVWGSSGPRAPAHGKAHAVALWGIGVMLLSVVIAVFSPALEDAIYPPLAFAILGLAWAMTREVGAPERDVPVAARAQADL